MLKKQTLFGALLFCVFATGASAQVATDPKFDGQMVIVTATTPACDPAGRIAAVPNSLLATYRPRMTQGQPNSANSGLSFSYLANYHIIKANVATSKLYGQGNYTGAKIHANVDLVSGYQGTYDFTITPAQAKLSASTEFVTIKGTITNFAGFTGCTVTVRAALARRQ
jgi:opacity protein-like surface antigen